MDKKELAAIVSSIAEKIAAEHKVSEGEARCLLGITLRRNAMALADAAAIRKEPVTVS